MMTQSLRLTVLTLLTICVTASWNHRVVAQSNGFWYPTPNRPSSHANNSYRGSGYIEHSATHCSSVETTCYLASPVDQTAPQQPIHWPPLVSTHVPVLPAYSAPIFSVPGAGESVSYYPGNPVEFPPPMIGSTGVYVDPMPIAASVEMMTVIPDSNSPPAPGLPAENTPSNSDARSEMEDPNPSPSDVRLEPTEAGEPTRARKTEAEIITKKELTELKQQLAEATQKTRDAQQKAYASEKAAQAARVAGEKRVAELQNRITNMETELAQQKKAALDSQSEADKLKSKLERIQKSQQEKSQNAG